MATPWTDADERKLRKCLLMVGMETSIENALRDINSYAESLKLSPDHLIFKAIDEMWDAATLLYEALEEETPIPPRAE